MKNILFVVLAIFAVATVSGCTEIGKGKDPVVVTNG